MRRKIFLHACLLVLSLWCSFPSRAETAINYSDFSQWQMVKGEHFVVYYVDRSYASTSSDVLRKAEEYYDKIAYQIGYSRYSDFWTWEDRVKIFIFPDQISFLTTTGQKAWSRGYSLRDSKLFESRAIVTFAQEEGFIDRLLPHEVAHLIVKDFIGFDQPLPVWFEEGLAQHFESTDPSQEQIMAFMARSGQFIPFELLHRADVRLEKDELKVGVFYAQSRSIIDFLIKVYGQAAFQQFCILLRDRMEFREALSRAYSQSSIDSLDALQEKWQRYMQDK